MRIFVLMTSLPLWKKFLFYHNTLTPPWWNVFLNDVVFSNRSISFSISFLSFLEYFLEGIQIVFMFWLSPGNNVGNLTLLHTTDRWFSFAGLKFKGLCFLSYSSVIDRYWLNTFSPMITSFTKSKKCWFHVLHRNHSFPKLKPSKNSSKPLAPKVSLEHLDRDKNNSKSALGNLGYSKKSSVCALRLLGSGKKAVKVPTNILVEAKLASIVPLDIEVEANLAPKETSNIYVETFVGAMFVRLG